MSQKTLKEQEYSLQTLLEELPKQLGVTGKMNAYKKLAAESDRSVGEVRRWFSATNSKFYRPPPMDKRIWLLLEDLSGNQLSRDTYYPKPDSTFWDKE